MKKLLALALLFLALPIVSMDEEEEIIEESLDTDQYKYRSLAEKIGSYAAPGTIGLIGAGGGAFGGYKVAPTTYDKIMKVLDKKYASAEGLQSELKKAVGENLGNEIARWLHEEYGEGRPHGYAALYKFGSEDKRTIKAQLNSARSSGIKFPEDLAEKIKAITPIYADGLRRGGGAVLGATTVGGIGAELGREGYIALIQYLNPGVNERVAMASIFAGHTLKNPKVRKLFEQARVGTEDKRALRRSLIAYYKSLFGKDWKNSIQQFFAGETTLASMGKDVRKLFADEFLPITAAASMLYYGKSFFGSIVRNKTALAKQLFEELFEK